MPLPRLQHFSDEETALLAHYIFTNPLGETSMMHYNELVRAEELSPIASAVSRTHVSTVERTLDFIDKEKMAVARDLIPHIRAIVQLTRSPDGSLVVSKRAADFNQKWVIGHGHSSIKEETQLFGFMEHISDCALDALLGHPLSRPQVKSTRYISYGEVLDRSLSDPDILRLPNPEKFLEYIRFMNRRYLEVMHVLADAVHAHPDTRAYYAWMRSEPQAREHLRIWTEQERKKGQETDLDQAHAERHRYLNGLSLEKQREDAEKFVLDYSRMYLLAVTKTSTVFSVDARTLEEVITRMISHPRIEEQQRGRELREEAMKLAPVLMGEKSHIREDSWYRELMTTIGQSLVERFGRPIQEHAQKPSVRLYDPHRFQPGSDLMSAALIVFHHTNLPLDVIMECITASEAHDIIDAAHSTRGDVNELHPAMAHSGLFVEFMIGVHAYRDLFRHRNGHKTPQPLTTRHGFEVPEIYDTFGLTREYLKHMAYATEIFEEAYEHDPLIAQKLVPFGALRRALHSWSPQQVAYVTNLRGRIRTGHRSYVQVVRQLAQSFREQFPVLGAHLRVDTSEYPAHLIKRAYDWHDQGRPQ